jgi:DNA-binding NarL/FixJ family response regulator
MADLPDLRHLGIASNGSSGLDLCRALYPDIVILEPDLPDMDGLSLIDELVRAHSGIRIVLFTLRADEVLIRRCDSPEISGLVWKTERDLDPLLKAVSEVGAGRNSFPIEFKSLARDRASGPDDFFKILTKRELQLLPLLGRGLSDEEIAPRFEIKPGTVRIQRQGIMAKLNLHRREQIMRWAIEKGFAHFPRPAPPCEFSVD